MNGLAVVFALIAVALRIDAIGNPELNSTATGICFGIALAISAVWAIREFWAGK